MRRTANVDALLAQLPADDPDRLALQARAVAYSRDCGCAMGGAFMAGALLLALLYVAAVGGLSIWRTAAVVAFVLVAALAGKVVGLGMASARLALLRRSIVQRLGAEGGVSHVHVH